jgi:hypothetical protein
MTAWTLQRQLAELIELLLDRHPQGLRVLLGDVDPPRAGDVKAMLSGNGGDVGVRVDGGLAIPEAERILLAGERFDAVVDAAGGWDHIAATTRDWARFYPSTWAIVVDHVAFVGPGDFSRVDVSRLEMVAHRHGVHRDTVWRRRRDFPHLLAECILRAPSVSCFELRAGLKS